MKRLLTCLLVAPLLVLFAACSGTSTLTSEGFDKSCSKEQDCVAVAFGDLCKSPHCNCANDAINVSGKSKYDAEAQDVLASCDTPEIDIACECTFRALACEGGVCVLH